MEYVPLQVISAYSLLQSNISILNLVHTAKQRGYSSIALTDRNVMYGAVEFYNACKKANIHPIIGLTLSLKGIIKTNQSFDLLLLARNSIGYHNLMKISTIKMSLNKNEELDWGQIHSLLDGLYIINPINGELMNLVKSNQEQSIIKYLNVLKKSCSNDWIKFGISIDSYNQYINLFKMIQAQLNIKPVILSPIYYLNPEELFSIDVLRSIENSKSISNPVSSSKVLGMHWLKPMSNLINRFHKNHFNQAVQESNIISQNCNVEIKKHSTQLPHFNTPNDYNSKEYLSYLCKKGLRKRLNQNNIHKNKFKYYINRLKYELSIINRMQFTDYFLIVWDVINFAHQHHIMTGPGRGSAAGSLVAYVLYITDVDPIQYNLLFERFLNEERAQMPDIDLDIPDDRRDDILEYVHQKYGHNRVAQIITFDTMAAKQSIRDVGRIFKLNSKELNRWSESIPSVLHITLKEAYQHSKKLRNIVNDSELNKLLFKTAKQLEGLPRHYSTHAAGLILSDYPLVKRTPLQNGNENLLMTQYSKNYAEEVGLLKIDFLGLRNLTFLSNIIKNVKDNFNSNLDIRNINMNDKATLKLFSKADTNGIFQFESRGIKRVLKCLQPTDFNLVAVVDALYRPGPMHNINSFIKRKNGQEKINYPDDSLKDILAPTYGIIIYQEQVMMVASKMGGFTLGQSDILRRAMSKKNHKVMESMRLKFINGSIHRGYSKDIANQTFNYIDSFASYGFNKSHATAYSKMAYELAYLKTHYPISFFTELLNSILGDNDKTQLYLMEAKKRNIKILSPNINLSQKDFSVYNNSILFGFGALETLNNGLITVILNNRKNNRFTSFTNFVYRIYINFIKDRHIENKDRLLDPLIYSGALDTINNIFISDDHEIKLTRDKMSNAYNSLLRFLSFFVDFYNDQDSYDKYKDFQSLQGLKTISSNGMSSIQLLQKENYYLKRHPVEQFNNLNCFFPITSVNNLSIHNYNPLMILFISNIRIIRNKNGQQMAFAFGDDSSGDLNLVIFSKVYLQIKKWFHTNMVILVKGKIEKDKKYGLQLLVSKMQPATNIQTQLKHRRLYLKLSNNINENYKIIKLYNLIKRNRGSYRIVIYEAYKDSVRLLKYRYTIDNNPIVRKKLYQIFGNKNVVFK